MALILIVVGLAVVTEYGVIQPIRDRLERWREAGLPWGVHR
jgi:NitT/TauT family transport system permease protein